MLYSDDAQNNVITGTALGSKYFHNTTFKCEDENSGEKVDRYVYYDNVPPKTGDSEPGLLDGINILQVKLIPVNLNPFIHKIQNLNVGN